MKRLLSMILVLLLLTNALPLQAAAEGENLPFTDVPENHWAYSYVKWSYENGIFKGKAEDKFCPDDKLSRGELVTVLGRYAQMLGEPYSSEGYTDMPFTDVAANSYCAPYVAWAYQFGIVNGTSATTFAPGMVITREQFVTIVYRFLSCYIGIDADDAKKTLTFTDTAKIADFAKDGAAAIFGLGFVGGKPGNLFDPQGSAVRSEASKILSLLSASVDAFMQDETLVIATKEGIFPSMTEDMGPAIGAAIAKLDEGQTFVLARGKYLLGRVIEVTKDNITIDGNGATMVQEPGDMVEDGFPSTDSFSLVFRLTACKDITLRNFKLDTVVHEFIGGDVTNAEAVQYTDTDGVKKYHFYLYYTIDDGYVCTGKEKISQLVTLDASGKTDNALIAGDSLKLEPRPFSDAQEVYLGNNKWRLELNVSDVHSVQEFTSKDSRIRQFDYEGQRVEISVMDVREDGTYAMRHGTGVDLNGVENGLIENIQIYSGAFSLNELNRNITFEGCKIKPESTKTGLSCDVTGIWGVPPKGYLHINNCEFWGFGDDQINLFARETGAYNINTTSNTLYTYNSYDQWEENLEVGDLIYAYDPSTRAYHGSFVVTGVHYGEAENGKMVEYKPNDDFNVQHGDALCNQANNQTETIISNCTFLNGRVRSVCYQAGNLTVENCYMNTPVQLLCDLDEWNEGSSWYGSTIRNCTFENIGTEFFRTLYGYGGSSAIDISCGVPAAVKNGTAELSGYPFRDIVIENNTFKTVQGNAIRLDYTQNVTIRNNTMTDCGLTTTSGSYRFRAETDENGFKYQENGLPVGRYQTTFAIHPEQHYQVYAEHSDNVKVENNTYNNLVTGTRQDSDGNSNDLFFVGFADTCADTCAESGNKSVK